MKEVRITSTVAATESRMPSTVLQDACSVSQMYRERMRSLAIQGLFADSAVSLGFDLTHKFFHVRFGNMFHGVFSKQLVNVTNKVGIAFWCKL